MSTSSPHHEAHRRSITLSRLATIFAVVFAMAFGLCTVSATAIVGGNQKIGAGLIWTSAAIECICLLGLLAIGLVAIVRSIRAR
jgi:hypothetical protein